jgi:hypothetical protein
MLRMVSERWRFWGFSIVRDRSVEDADAQPAYGRWTGEGAGPQAGHLPHCFAHLHHLWWAAGPCGTPLRSRLVTGASHPCTPCRLLRSYRRASQEI